MNFIDRLERRFGRFGVPDLMKYVIGINILGIVLELINPNVYDLYLSLDMYKVLHGQVWRLITFVLYPSVGRDAGFVVNLIWFAIWAYVYYSIGTTLERMWGAFRFTLFYIGGVIFVVLVTLITYLVMVPSLSAEGQAGLGAYLETGVTLAYLNQTLFLAFAAMFPDAQFLLYFIVPIKAKWMLIVYLVLNGWELVQCLMAGGIGGYYTAALIVGALVNFFLFYFFGKGKPGVHAAYRQKQRKAKFKQRAREPGGPRHRCAICGKTEEDAPSLEFRYCTKCEGNYEYCSEHLFTHEHVHRS
ncbi:MAG: hypothetical protein J1F02_00645 [Lachnospiraceae bacterium]|nr:hypothetical protein [Lachnospiraceae bacterium]